MRVPCATTASMIGWIVFCWTLASICSTTCPPRWISPRIGGLSFASRPRPGAGAPQGAPFCPRGWLTLVPGHDVDLVDLHLTFRCCYRDPGRQSVAQLLG